MKPVKFQGHNQILAKSQPPYLPLPCLMMHNPQGEVISCWQLNWWERLQVFLAGKLWLSQWTFDSPLQPQRPTVAQPFEIE